MSNRTNRAGVVWVALLAAMHGSACSDSAEKTVTLNDLYVTTDEDGPVEIDVLDAVYQSNGDTLTVTSAVAAQHTVELLGGTRLKVTPKHDFNGTFNVSYVVSDEGAAVNGRLTVTVRAINDAPHGLAATMTVHGGTPIVLGGEDAEHDALTYEIVEQPLHGAIQGDAPKIFYAPEQGFVGDDQIRYVVRDGKATSEPATVLLHVTPGTAPVALPDEVSTLEDVAQLIFLSSTDPDVDPRTFTIVTSPLHGTLSGTAPILTYTPTRDFHGVDSFEFSVNDGYVESNTATITVTVLSVADTPVAVPQTIAAAEDTAMPITLDASDGDGDPLTFSIWDVPHHGVLTGSGRSWTYTPGADYHGPDSFSFSVSDGTSHSLTATVAIDVAAVDDPPVASPVPVTLAEDTPSFVFLRGSDNDGDPLTYAITTPPAHGTLSGSAPVLAYTPDADYNGPDSFTYTVSSAGVTSEPAMVSLTVTPVDDPPVATPDSVTTNEETPVSFVLRGTDLDSPSLRFSIISFPSDGTATLNGATVTYVPALNATGSRTLRFVAIDDHASSVAATVNISILPMNDPPTAHDDYVATDPGTPITFSVLTNDTDVDGDVLRLDAPAAPAHGTIEMIENNQLVYTPAPGFTGTEVFDYIVLDGHDAVATGHVHMGVGEFPAGAPSEAIPVGSSANVAPQTLAICSNGRFIALSTRASLVASDTNGFEDIYLYDRGTHALTRASVTSDGSQATGASTRPQLSADGRYVVFESAATNLVVGDTNAATDVFRHDRVTGETVRISVATGGGQGSGETTDSRISDDGNLVAFASTSFELVDGDGNGVSDIFVRDVTAGTTTRISVSTSGGDVDLASISPAISGDGRFVAFASSATNLVSVDANGVSDVFLRDRVGGTTTRISISTTGGESNRDSMTPSISRDGRFVSFSSSATNLVPGATRTFQLFVRDLQSQITTWPGSLNGVQSAQLSRDGRYAMTSSVLLVDRLKGDVVSPPGSGNWVGPTISGDGHYLVARLSSITSLVIAPNPL